MSHVSAAYELAETVHSRLFNDSANQARGFLTEGEVRADVSEPYKTQRLTIRGEVDGHRAIQHLSRSQKTGGFYLSTVFSPSKDKVPGQRMTRITPEVPDDVIDVVEESLFMGAFRRAA